METFNAYIPHLTLGGVAALATICGIIWRSIRSLATIEDVERAVIALRNEFKTETQIIHNRINKMEAEYKEADEQQSKAFDRSLNRVEQHLSNDLRHLSDQVNQLTGALLLHKE